MDEDPEAEADEEADETTPAALIPSQFTRLGSELDVAQWRGFSDAIRKTSAAADLVKGFDLTSQLMANQASLEAALDDMMLPERQRVARERQGLELSSQIVEQQRLLVETQQALLAAQAEQAQRAEAARVEQARDAAVDRRIEIAVLVIAILGMAVTVATDASGTVTAVVAGVVVVIIAALVTALIMRGRPRRRSKELGSAE